MNTWYATYSRKCRLGRMGGPVQRVSARFGLQGDGHLGNGLNKPEPPGGADKMLISVLIPAYNAGPFLRRAVQSALPQTLAPLEVLIVNDASTDNTLDIAKALACEDARVRVISLPTNVGPAAARNA